MITVPKSPSPGPSSAQFLLPYVHRVSHVQVQVKVWWLHESNWKQPSWLTLVVNKYFAVIQRAHAWQGQILSRFLEGPNKFCQSSASGPLAILTMSSFALEAREECTGNVNPWFLQQQRRTRVIMFNIPRNLCMALYCILLCCFVLCCIVLLIYC